MQSVDFEDDVYKKWFRRPTLFLACAWFWLAAAGKALVPLLVKGLFAGLSRIFPVFTASSASLTANVVDQVFVLALPVLMYQSRHEGVERSMRLEKPHPAVLLSALAAGALAVPFGSRLSTWWAILIQEAGGQLKPGVSMIGSAAVLPFMILIYAVLPGICEELLFRGGILGAWERRGQDRGLIVSSLLFALLHGSIQGLPLQLMMGFVLGCVTVWSGSLYAGMGFHVIYNALSLVLSCGGLNEGETLLEAVSRSVGMGHYLIETLATGALFAGALIGFRALCGRLGAPKIASAVDETPLDGRDCVVLMAGLLTVLVFYGYDFLIVCGAVTV